MAVPDEKSALAALEVVQKLSGAELEKLIDTEVGPAMLGVMKAVARAQTSGGQPADEVRAVHLLVFGYLLRREVTRTGSTPR